VKHFVASVLGVAVLGLVGCGSQGSSVSGKVTYQGKPLTSGFVMFHPAEGPVLQSPIAADGTYRIEGAAAGRVNVAVTGPSKPVAGPDGVSADADAPAGPQVYIPEKYGMLETAGLAYDVTGAATQSHDIALE
jgi:hypothetical protein